MTPDEIRAAVSGSDAMKALGQDTAAIAAALSAGRTRVHSRIVSARGIASDYPGGPVAAEIVLMKLEGAATALATSGKPDDKVLGSLIARQLRFLAAEGLDMGAAALRGMLDQFVVAGILTKEESDGLKGLALVADPVDELDVRRALWADDGAWRG